LRDLDNQKRMDHIDSEGMLEATYRLVNVFANPSRFRQRLVSNGSRKDLVFVGMGGSASAGDVLLDWLSERIKVPSHMVRDFSIPRFVDAKSLVICLSYSGETKETLRAFQMARRRKCGIVGVGSGGTLERACKKFGIPFFHVEPGLVPRAALGQMVEAGARALQHARLVGSVSEELRVAGRELEGLRDKIEPSVPMTRNGAKLLAFRLKDRVPIIYVLDRMSSVARRFKNQLAENSKVVAKYESLPEACHNEVEFWTGIGKTFVPVLIRDWIENSEERLLIESFRSTITRKEKKYVEVRMRAKSSLGRVLAPILFLDYVSIYLAILKGVNPGETPRIKEYKEKFGAKI